MNGVGPADHTTREIARGLADVVENALEAGAPPLAASAAAEVARLLELRGLERVMLLAEARSGAHRPEALTHVLERVARLTALSRTRESVEPFVEADGELDALAASIGDQQWTPTEPAGPAVAAIGLDDALPGWMLRGLPEDAVLVGAPVAAALRAALDWLGADAEQPVDTEIHDDFVALRVHVAQAEGLEATGDVLATVGGHLAPERAGSRRWRLVVPRLLQRQAYLLVEQGRLGLALPWHSVLKLRMLAPERAAEEAQVLPPLRWTAAPVGERPAALIAHGLRRAWLFADRVVWRFAATPEEPDATAPVPGLSRAVRGEDGTLFWIADPAWLLRATPVVEPEWPADEPVVDDAPVADEASATIATPVEAEPLAAIAPVAEPADETPEPEAAPPASEWSEIGTDDAPVEWLVTAGPDPVSAPTPAPRPTLSLLRPEDVEPLDVAEPVAAPATAGPMGEDATAPAVDESPRALVESEDTPASGSAERPSRFMRALRRIAEREAAAAPGTPDVAPPELPSPAAEASAPTDADVAPIAESPTPDAPVESVATIEPVSASEAESAALAPGAVEIEVPAVAEPDAKVPSAEIAPAENPVANESAEAVAEAMPAVEPEAPAPVEPVPAPETELPRESRSRKSRAAAKTEPPAEAEPSAPTPAEPAPAAEAPAPAAPALPAEPLEISSRLALVAEDSLVANIFLQRLLEQRGFRTVSVELGVDLAREIARGGWGLVCVDVHLPDTAGAAHLAGAVTAAAGAPTGVAVIALTRDADDEKLAREAGVVHSLRKPFEAGSVDRLFAKLGLPTRGGRK